MMLGVDDFLVILAATTVANLVVEVGAEIIAEWWVHAPEGASLLPPGMVDPSAMSEPIRFTPELLTQISAKVDQTAVWSDVVMQRLSAKADVLSIKAGETALWSEQMISAAATSLGLQ